MSDVSLPACGIYRTLRAVGEVPAGRLVYFHNHGDPGPGIYLPAGWSHNRARFHERGHTLPQPYADHADALQPLPAEGMYRVLQPFTCCSENCVTFEADLLMQLGYNGNGDAIAFRPEMSDQGLVLPTTGVRVDRARLSSLQLLKVAEARPVQGGEPSRSASGMLH